MSFLQFSHRLSKLTQPASPQDLRSLLECEGIEQLQDDLVRIPLGGGPAAEAILIFWKPGGVSRIHDHGQSACVVRVLAGLVVEETFEPAGRGKVRKVGRKRYRPGDVFESAAIHRVSNPGSTWGVTLHVYSPRLKMTVWEEEST